MLWAISRAAKPNSAAMREKALQAHRDYLLSRKSAIIISGATLTDDGEEVTGSMLIVNLSSRAEAKAFSDGDPFTKAGMFESVTIKRMRKATWNPQAAEGA